MKELSRLQDGSRLDRRHDSSGVLIEFCVASEMKSFPGKASNSSPFWGMVFPTKHGRSMKKQVNLE